MTLHIYDPVSYEPSYVKIASKSEAKRYLKKRMMSLENDGCIYFNNRCYCGFLEV